MALEGIAKLGESDLETVAGGAISDIFIGMGDALRYEIGWDLPFQIRSYGNIPVAEDNARGRHKFLGSIFGRIIGMSTLIAAGYGGGLIFHKRKKIARYFGEKLIKWSDHK